MACCCLFDTKQHSFFLLSANTQLYVGDLIIPASLDTLPCAVKMHGVQPAANIALSYIGFFYLCQWSSKGQVGDVKL